MSTPTLEEVLAEGALAARLWVRVFGLLEQNWCLIEEQPQGRVDLVFFDDDGEVFDWIGIDDAEAAEAALAANGFLRVRERSSLLHATGWPRQPKAGLRRRPLPMYSGGERWRLMPYEDSLALQLRGASTPWPANHLQRFVDAQDPVWYDVLEELASGRKESHWMWFVFPQLRGLGESRTSYYYGLASMTEAAAYWDDDVLGERLRTCLDLLLALSEGMTAEDVLGGVDAKKLRSCLTLFDAVTGGNRRVGDALKRFFDGGRCERTRQMMAHDVPARAFRI